MNFKSTIEENQLKDLSNQALLAYRQRWGNSLVDIGQLIAFLQHQNLLFFQTEKGGSVVGFDYEGQLCDFLWEIVKKLLEKNSIGILI